MFVEAEALDSNSPDTGFFLDDVLLRSVGKAARGHCFRSKPLDGIHDICRLIKKSLLKE